MSTAAVNISLKSSFDSSGVSKAKDAVRDVSNYTDSLRKNSLFRENRAQSAGLLNLSRQASDVFSQGLAGTSPFTILVQQGPQILDILASGALSAGTFATALGGISVGVAGVMGAISSYQKMSEAIDDAADAQERFNKNVKGGLKYQEEKGIAPGEEARTIKQNEDAIADAEKKIQEYYKQAEVSARRYYDLDLASYKNIRLRAIGKVGPAPTFESAIESEYKKPDFIKKMQEQEGIIDQARKNISNIKELLDKGSIRLFEEKLSKDARQGIEQRGIESAAEMVSASQLKFMQEALASGLKKADAMQETPEKANLLNSLQYLSEWLTKLGTAVEKVQERRMGMARDELDRFFGDIDSASKENANNKQKSTPLAALRSAQVSARQSIGGMANAPILSSYQKQTDYLAKIAETSRMTAQNTSKTTLPAAPVSTAN